VLLQFRGRLLDQVFGPRLIGVERDDASPELGCCGAILRRELLYTALTRAEAKVTVVATPDAVRLAVQREAQRASGLAARLAHDPVNET